MAGPLSNQQGWLFPQQGIEEQALGRQPRRAAFWKAQHIHNM
jgi:hypothetical protein